MSKGSLNKSSNSNELKSLRKSSEPIKVGQSKPLQRLNTFVEKPKNAVKPVQNQFQMQTKVQRSNTFKETVPLESEGEDSSIYSEFNEDL